MNKYFHNDQLLRLGKGIEGGVPGEHHENKKDVEHVEVPEGEFFMQEPEESTTGFGGFVFNFEEGGNLIKEVSSGENKKGYLKGVFSNKRIPKYSESEISRNLDFLEMEILKSS